MNEPEQSYSIVLIWEVDITLSSFFLTQFYRSIGLISNNKSELLKSVYLTSNVSPCEKF